MIIWDKLTIKRRRNITSIVNQWWLLVAIIALVAISYTID